MFTSWWRPLVSFSSDPSTTILTVGGGVGGCDCRPASPFIIMTGVSSGGSSVEVE